MYSIIHTIHHTNVMNNIFKVFGGRSLSKNSIRKGSEILALICCQWPSYLKRADSFDFSYKVKHHFWALRTISTVFESVLKIIFSLDLWGFHQANSRLLIRPTIPLHSANSPQRPFFIVANTCVMKKSFLNENSWADSKKMRKGNEIFTKCGQTTFWANRFSLCGQFRKDLRVKDSTIRNMESHFEKTTLYRIW